MAQFAKRPLSNEGDSQKDIIELLREYVDTFAGRSRYHRPDGGSLDAVIAAAARQKRPVESFLRLQHDDFGSSLHDALLSVYEKEHPGFNRQDPVAVQRAFDDLSRMDVLSFEKMLRRHGDTLVDYQQRNGLGVYRQYPDEPLSPRLGDVKVDALRSSMSMLIDGRRHAFSLSDDVSRAYMSGALPANVLANKLLEKYDAASREVESSYSRGMESGQDYVPKHRHR